MARKANKAGRSKGSGRFVPIPHAMLQSTAWRSLSGPAVKVYIELHSRYNGRNNGDLSLSYREASNLLNISKSSVQRAFDELREKGFIIRTSEGAWYGRRAATWATTDNTVDLPKFSEATHAYKRWKAERNVSYQKHFLGTEAGHKTRLRPV